MADATEMAFNACARIRRESTVENFPQCLTRNAEFLNVSPQDANVGGWLYMSSNDSFCIWTIQTNQDRVEVTAQRKTGPASWSRFWISSGALVSVRSSHQSGIHIDDNTGLITTDPALPTLRAWFYPYSENEAFETFQFSFGGNPWDDFPVIAAAANANVGYAPRLCRALYLNSNTNLTVNTGIEFVNYARIPSTDQSGIFVDGWTSVNILNGGGVGATILGSWANTPVSLLNP